MVTAYHAGVGLGTSSADTAILLEGVLAGPSLGRLAVIRAENEAAGYALLTFGFSLE